MITKEDISIAEHPSDDPKVKKAYLAAITKCVVGALDDKTPDALVERAEINIYEDLKKQLLAEVYGELLVDVKELVKTLVGQDLDISTVKAVEKITDRVGDMLEMFE